MWVRSSRKDWAHFAATVSPAALAIRFPSSQTWSWHRWIRMLDKRRGGISPVRPFGCQRGRNDLYFDTHREGCYMPRARQPTLACLHRCIWAIKQPNYRCTQHYDFIIHCLISSILRPALPLNLWDTCKITTAPKFSANLSPPWWMHFAVLCATWSVNFGRLN